MPLFDAYGINLRKVELEDLELLRQWRSRPDIASQMLNSGAISPEQQQAWFRRISQDNSQAYFLLADHTAPIGSCNLKAAAGETIDQASTLESGFYLADARYRGSMLAFLPALALNQYCFTQLRCQTLVAHVKLDNLAALRFNRQLGYQDDQQVEVVTATGPMILLRMVLTASMHQQAARPFARFNKSASRETN